MERAHLENESGKVRSDYSEPVLAWKVHVLKECPKKLLLIAPVVLVSLFVSYVIFQSLFFTAAVCLLFLSALAEYLFPIRFEIDAAGATSRTLKGRTTIEWDRVKKYYLDDRGIKLSTLSRKGRLEAYRGVYLRFGDNRDEVIRVVRRMRDARDTDDAVSGGGTLS